MTKNGFAQFPIFFVIPALIITAGFVVYSNNKETNSAPIESTKKPQDLTDNNNLSLNIYEGSYGYAKITKDSKYRYIKANGLPEHKTGTFPNRGNPNAITEQDISYKVLLNPVYSEKIIPIHLAGVALNGIPLAPSTAEIFNNDINWAIEAFGPTGKPGLGIDWSNAHVQPNGMYHYHGVPNGLLEDALKDQSGDLIQLAWASDGFSIYYSQSNAYKSSWRIKKGIRPDGPGGSYDGTYNQDFEYIENSGNLDECNGTFIKGSYAYFFTNTFPYIQRCVHGTPDMSFDRMAERQIPSNIHNKR